MASLKTAGSARARFQRFAEEQLLADAGTADRAELQGLLRQRPSATKSACRSQRQRLVERVGSAAGSGLLYGSTAALDRPGACWALVYAGQLSLGLGASLDLESGEVLVVWWIPEG